MGMGVEVPVWVITTAKNKKYFNPKTKQFVTELSPDCAISLPTEANNLLKALDFGYVVKTARHYIDIHENKIWMVD